MKFQAYTDHPMTELGDLPNQEAPIREVTVVGYDRDKYCQVQLHNFTKEIKAGYLYSAPGRLDEVPSITYQKLLTLPDF